MVKPFAHQRQCLRTLENIRGNTKKIERKALIVMASGLGKTVTSALDVKKIMAHFPWLRVLYLCHQNYILKQARETFELVLGNQNGKTFGYYHGLKKEIEAQLLFASFQTMRDSLDKFRKNAFDYVVVDESHHVPAETFHPVVRHFKPRFMLGMTATPDRMDMQDIRKTFGTEIFSLDLPDALAQKLLTAVDYRIVTDEIVKLGEIKNPYRLSMKELNRRIFVPKRDREIVKIIEQKIQAVKNPKVMIFCPSIRYAEKLRKKIIWSTTIHSQLPQDEQERRLEAFHQGKYDTVLTVDKFNEGIDIPEINVLVFLRSTQSHTVFYQQLGRGLRKLPGKKKVLVLDFVANCERVELIHELVEEVKKKTPRKPKRPRKPEKEIVLRSGNFRFTEKARDILNILKAKRSGYTREILIKQLQDLAIKLGRTPNETDIGGANKRGECASSVVFQKHLGHGSLIVAQKTAGLEPTRPDYTGYTKIKLIKEYQSLAKELGRVPCWHDLEKASKDGKCARPRIFYKYFDGKIKKLRKAARLEPDKELIKQLQGLAKELGRTPNKTDIGEANKEGRCASLNTFKRFGRGKLSTAQKMAGLTPNGKNIPSKKTAIKQLQSLAKELGRTPDCNDIVMANQNGMCPSLYAFYKFGGIVAVRKSAKLKLNRKSYTEKVLIKQLQDLAKELGRTPNKTDIGEANKEGRCASLNTFKRFGRGKLSTAQKMTGLTPTKKRLFSRPR